MKFDKTRCVFNLVKSDCNIISLPVAIFKNKKNYVRSCMVNTQNAIIINLLELFKDLLITIIYY